MITYKNLLIIGTSHISLESVKQVEFAIIQQKPDIVAIELDSRRFHALLQKTPKKSSLKQIRQTGIKGFLFNLAGAYIEKKLGELTNSPPGSEMKKAIESARSIKADIAFIDQDITITLKKLSKRITWKEKFNFLIDILKSMSFKQKINFNIKKVPSRKIVEGLTKKIKKRYPSIYKTLITERDQIMAQNLLSLLKKDKKIIAVVGIGHETGIIKHLKSNA